MNCDKGLNELRANPCQIRTYTMVVKAEGYWTLSFFPSEKMKDALMALTEGDSGGSKFNIPRGKAVYTLSLNDTFRSDLGRDCRVHDQATLSITVKGTLSLTFFLTEDKGKELTKLPSYQLPKSAVPT
jgi:hypothetical protein